MRRLVLGQDEGRAFQVHGQDFEKQVCVRLGGVVVDPMADIAEVELPAVRVAARTVEGPAAMSGPLVTSAFHELYKGQDFLLWVKNSVIVTLSVTFLRVFLDSLAGYALARLRFRGRGAAFATIVAVMAVPGVVLLIPKFLIIRCRKG